MLLADKKSSSHAPSCPTKRNLLENPIGLLQNTPAIRSSCGHRSCYSVFSLNNSGVPGLIGTTISHYRIVGKLGEGGMGVVYLAEDILLGRRVAIKTLGIKRGGEDRHFRARFLREARAVSALSHPHIATIHDYGESEAGTPYIVMELIEGPTLGDLIREESLTLPRIITIIRQVAEALGEAHRQGIIHRDIKPSNVATNKRGDVKVLDFGLAKQLDLNSVSDPEGQTLMHTQTREGVIVGTPMYLSPEQALGVDIDARSDLFSLGALLYECIAGQPPFFGKSSAEICARVLRDDPPPPSHLNFQVPPLLDQVALKALAKKPEARYQSAEEMIAALDEVQETLQGHTHDRTVTRLMASSERGHRTGALATLSDIFKRPRLSIGYVVAGLVVVSLLSYVAWRLTRSAPHTPNPEAQKIFDKGVVSLQEGSYLKASKQFERAISIDENFAMGHARLAEAYAELDYGDKARDEMLIASRLLRDQSALDRASALYFDAISATVAHDLPAAINNYSEVAKLKPNESASYLDLGHAFENHDELDKAIEQYSKAAALDANNAAPPLRLAVLQGRRQDLASANAGFDKSEGLYKDDQNVEGGAEVSYQRGYLLSQMSKIPEAQRAAEQSLNLANAADNRYQQVRALLLLSTIAYSSGNTEEAQKLVTRALDLARSNGMENLVTQGLLDLGNSLLLKRSFTEAETYATQALTLAQTYREKRNEARANLLLGSIYMQQEQVDKASPLIDRALTFYQAGGYRREVSRCMIMVGRAQLLRGDFDGAVKTLDEQLELAKQVEDPGEIARSQQEVASALSKQDLYPQALVRYTQSYELNKTLGNSLRIAFALLNRADMLMRLGYFDDAKEAVIELGSNLQQLSNDNQYKQLWTAWSHLYLARMYLSQRQWPEAKSESAKALAIAAKDDLETQAESKAVQCLVEVSSGSPSTGRTLCEQAWKLLGPQADSTHRAHVELALAEARLESGDAKNALEAGIHAQQTLAKTHELELEWQCWLIMARANQRLGNSDIARRQLSTASNLLNGLKQKWDDKAFDSYLNRRDIQIAQRQMESLTEALVKSA
jgi:serine/threonine protein kinase/Flp pilus assembly protein TadD